MVALILVLDGEASAVSFSYGTSLDPLGVSSGALVLWGSAGLSNNDLDVLFGRWLGTCETCVGLLNTLSWGSGVWIRAIFAKGDVAFPSGLRDRFRFVFANVLGAGSSTKFSSWEE